MLDAVVGYTTSTNLAVVNGVFNRSPAVQARSLATIWGMEEEQINVAQSTFLDGSFDGFSCYIIRRIGG